MFGSVLNFPEHYSDIRQSSSTDEKWVPFFLQQKPFVVSRSQTHSLTLSSFLVSGLRRSWSEVGLETISILVIGWVKKCPGLFLSSGCSKRRPCRMVTCRFYGRAGEFQLKRSTNDRLIPTCESFAAAAAASQFVHLRTGVVLLPCTSFHDSPSKQAKAAADKELSKIYCQRKGPQD